MPKYKCHKEVWALKIKDIDPGRLDGEGPGVTLNFVRSEKYTPLSVSDLWESKHRPKDGDYLVVYEDGYKSVSPAKDFEAGYILIGSDE